MSANLGDPFPHAFTITPGATALSPAPIALLLLGVAATTASIQIMTVGGETLTLTFSVAALPAVPSIYIPIQVQKVLAATGITTIVGLYH